MALTTALEKGADPKFALITLYCLNVEANIYKSYGNALVLNAPSSFLRVPLPPISLPAQTPPHHVTRTLGRPPPPTRLRTTILSDPKIKTLRAQQKALSILRPPMDPRHKLYKSLDKLTVSESSKMSARTDSEAQQAQQSTGVTIEGLKQKLARELGAEYVEIEDLSGTF